jgi:ABC-2 type transport system ATP-binding protein
MNDEQVTRADCARQTSDHRAENRLPFLVITTPESFDSMLARRSRFSTDGRPEGHALDTVEAIKGRLGEGDVFEIDLAAGEGADLLPMLEGVVPDHPAPSIQGDRLSFTASRGAELLPAVLRRIGERGLHLKGLRVRPRTLEDVFIRLTGRGLRE